MRIVFFGTPEFAVPSLRALLREGHDVAGVVTQPDRPRGRSRSTLVPPPVKRVAEQAGIPVLQPERPVGDLFLASLRRLEADLGIVVAYGHILHPAVLAVPTLGMINVHASILPRYRGAAPIQWAIARGEAATGITIMQMEAGLDSGPVVHTLSTEILPDETGGELTGRLAELGATALIEALSLIRLGATTPRKQNHDLATLAPKITRETARIDWSRSASDVAALIRALDPTPGAWTMLHDQEMKLFCPHVVVRNGHPGEILDTGADLVIAAGSGAVSIGEVQPAGRRRLPASEWLRGVRNTAGEVLG